MNLNKILAIGGLATMVAVNSGCDTPGGNYANQAAYNSWAGQLANQGDYTRANAAANVGTFFGSMGNASAANQAAEKGRSQVNQNIYIGSENSQRLAPVQESNSNGEMTFTGNDGISKVYKNGKLIRQYDSQEYMLEKLRKCIRGEVITE